MVYFIYYLLFITKIICIFVPDFESKLKSIVKLIEWNGDSRQVKPFGIIMMFKYMKMNEIKMLWMAKIK